MGIEQSRGHVVTNGSVEIFVVIKKFLFLIFANIETEKQLFIN